MGRSPTSWRAALCCALLVPAAVIAAPPDEPERATAAFKVVHDFSPDEGTGSTSALAVGRNGKLYGAAFNGGAFGRGTAFRALPGGAVEVLRDFGDERRPVHPMALTLGSDGWFYGITYGALGRGAGSVFRMTPHGKVKVLKAFTSDACHTPVAPLVEASDGHFYGSTTDGGAFSAGCIFRISSSGEYTVLRELHPQTDGSGPIARLLEGADGSFYGTLPNVGPRDGGSIFRMTREGELTVLHAFRWPAAENSARGLRMPSSALTLGPDGHFYGMASYGGRHSEGGVYRVSTAGELAVVHEFTTGSDGGRPTGDLVLGRRDGRLYGVNSVGGARSAGVAFSVGLDGSFTVLHAFDDTREGRPYAGLVELEDGVFYSLTPSGGDRFGAALYRIRVK